MSKKPKHKRKFFILFAFVVVGFFAVLTIFGDEGLVKLRQLYALRDRIRQENQDLFQNNQKLLQETSLLKDPVFAERLIREKLGYVKSKEYILILDERAASESQSSQNPTQTLH
ncbi:MAG: septum formation initiator family protein [bacterium]